MVERAKVPEYDPRYEVAQSIGGAKARYLELDNYGLADLERDLERLLGDG